MSVTAFLNTFPVNPADPAIAPILNDLQGNILKGHGRDFTFNLFLSFKAGQQQAMRNWIASFSSAFVTSARKQLNDTQLFQTKSIPGGIFASFFLSAKGYLHLGVPEKMPQESSFAHGMQVAGIDMHDPGASEWDAGLNGAGGPLHAMILVADDDVHLARSMARAIQASLAGLADVVATERGVVLRNGQGDGIEHNNYVDGISQPIFFQPNPLEPTDQWDPSAVPSLMLVPDHGGKDANSLGSFFVFRKLEQNVKGFKLNEKEVARTLFHLPPGDPETSWSDDQKEQAELAGALIVGRFESGTPVLLSKKDTDPAPGQQENNFNYLVKDSEFRCPFQAHIRKSGPRTDAQGHIATDSSNVAANKSARLVRRGIPFENAPRIRTAAGELSDKPSEQPIGGVGLLFMCYVANIATQFEVVQKRWVNNPDSSQKGTGKDPLIGQPAAGSSGTTFQWPPVWGDSTQPMQAAPFHDFIKLKGGEYFFAPCLSMLQSLAVVQLPATGAALNPLLQLFVPNKADIGAGVVHKN